MLRCDDYHALVFDHLYGLLEPAEQAAVEGHLAGCPGCHAALVAARKEQTLFARAAKLPFPSVTFAAPATVTPVRPPVRTGWAGWVIAAGLLLALGGLVGPAIIERQKYETAAAKVKQSLDAVQTAEAEKENAAKAIRTASDTAEKVVAAAEQKYAATAREWVLADAKAYSASPLTLSVTGPTAAVPGAPNDYAVTASKGSGQSVPVRLEATVRDATGAVVKRMQTPLGAAKDAKLRLPADLWAERPNGADDLFLAITATDAAGQKATLNEPIRLLAPIHTTFLTTDRPLYRPGDAVYFRSLTLDRAKFQPPTRDVVLRYELIDAQKKPIPNGAIVGRTEPVTNGQSVLGPDGKPVRGVGTGAFHLPDNLPGGEYTLVAREDGSDGVLLASRKIIVQQYAPEKWLKTLEFDARSYGPGDKVTAKLTVGDQSKPASVQFFATVTGATVRITDPGRTDANGSATISFMLPPELPAGAVSLSVRIVADPTETIIRPLPVVTAAVKLEFFPEGGDLIAGVPNRVYFRATSSAGTPVDVTGYLTDGSRSLLPVKTLTDADYPGVNQGLGVFEFTPTAGTQYAVKVLRPTTATAGQHDLSAATTGVTMSIPAGVTAADEPIRVSLASGTARRLLVGAYCRGVPVAHTRVELPAKKSTVVPLIPRTKIGGVTRVTVFEELPAANGRFEAKPVAERLIFRKPAEQLTLKLTPDRAGYAPGDKATVGIAAMTESGGATAAILWAAVANQSVLTASDDRTERSLPTHFLLAGEVQSPDKLEFADFLLTPHPRAAESLDLLLGTQGWRRFAEQSGNFRSSVTAEDREQFLISTGLRRQSLESAGANVVVTAHRPAFDAAARELAEATAKADAIDGTPLAAAKTRAAEATSGCLADADAVSPLLDSVSATQPWRTWALGGGLVVSLFGFVARLGFRFGPPIIVWVLAAAGFAAGAYYTLTPCDASWQPSVDALRASVPNGTQAASLEGPTLTRADVEGGQATATKTSVRQNLSEVAARFRTAENRPGRSPNGLSTRFGESSSIEPAFRRGLKEAPTPEQLAAVRRVDRQIAHPPLVVREYAHVHKTGDVRTDFADTVFWHPVLVLPAAGTGSISFDLPDSVTAYRVLVAGHTLDGRLGSTTTLIEVKKPLTVGFKLPSAATVGDRIDLPVTVTNGTQTPRYVRVTVGDANREMDVPARGAVTSSFPISVTTVGDLKVRASTTSDELTDAVERTMIVIADGFPAGGSVGGVLGGKSSVTVRRPEGVVPGSFTATLAVFSNPLGEVRAGMAGMLREPHGCFEQSSAANYPNVLILDGIREKGSDEAKTAQGVLDRGYTRLTGFEVPKPTKDGRAGFEWFGQFPPHGPLTAFGLMQFADMARVHPVDPGLIARTREFLLATRNGTGGFTREQNKHSFGDVPPAVADTYTLWAITESEKGLPPSDLSKETDAAVAAAGSDSYLLALVANVLANRGDTQAAEIARKLAAAQLPDGTLPPPATTITRSAGPDAATETTALAALAWIRAGDAFAANAAAAMRAIAGRRTPTGTFGATQASVLALKAIAEYGRNKPTNAGAGKVVVRVGGRVIHTLNLSPTGSNTLAFSDADRLFPTGETAVELEATDAVGYPFTIAWTGRSLRPVSDTAAIRLRTTLTPAEPTEGQTVRLTAELTNATDAGQGMVVATVGLPAGLRLPSDAKQIGDQVTAGKIDLWEQAGRELVFYRRGLAPKETVTVEVDLIADVPGEFRGPAGRAYLYYHPQAVVWTDPLSVRIRPGNR